MSRSIKNNLKLNMNYTRTPNYKYICINISTAGHPILVSSQYIKKNWEKSCSVNS